MCGWRRIRQRPAPRSTVRPRRAWADSERERKVLIQKKYKGIHYSRLPKRVVDEELKAHSAKLAELKKPFTFGTKRLKPADIVEDEVFQDVTVTEDDNWPTDEEGGGFRYYKSWYKQHAEEAKANGYFVPDDHVEDEDDPMPCWRVPCLATVPRDVEEINALAERRRRVESKDNVSRVSDHLRMDMWRLKKGEISHTHPVWRKYGLVELLYVMRRSSTAAHRLIVAHLRNSAMQRSRDIEVICTRKTKEESLVRRELHVEEMTELKVMALKFKQRLNVLKKETAENWTSPKFAGYHARGRYASEKDMKKAMWQCIKAAMSTVQGRPDRAEQRLALEKAWTEENDVQGQASAMSEDDKVLENDERFIEDDVPLDPSLRRKRPRQDFVSSLIHQEVIDEEQDRTVDRDIQAVHTVDGRYFPHGRWQTEHWERSTVGMMGPNHRDQHCKYWVLFGNCNKYSNCNFAHDQQARRQGWYSYETWYKHTRVTT